MGQGQDFLRRTVAGGKGGLGTAFLAERNAQPSSPGDGGRRGSSPERPINEQHPGLSWWGRWKTQNLTGGDPDVAASHLESLGFDVVKLPGFEFAIKKKGVQEPWRKVESNNGEWSDITDVAGGAFTTAGQIAGGVIGAGAGAIAGLAGGPAAPVTSTGLALLKGAAGAAAGGAVTEGILGGIGEMVGVHRTPMQHVVPALTEGAVGAAGEALAPVLDPILRPVVKTALSPLKYGAKKLGELGGFFDKATGATSRKLGAEIAEKQAGIQVDLGRAGADIPRFEADVKGATEARKQAVKAHKEAEAALRAPERALEGEIGQKQAYIDEALTNAGSELPRLRTKLNSAIGARRGVSSELSVAKDAARKKLEAEFAEAQERSILEAESGLDAARESRPGAFTMEDAPELKKAGTLYAGRKPGQGIKVTTDEAIDAAKTEIAEGATGYGKVIEGLGGKAAAVKREMYGGADFANPARFATASHLEAHPELVKAVSGFGPQFLPRAGGQKIGSWSIRSRESNLFHLFNDRRPVFDRGWNQFKSWFGKTAKAAIDDLGKSVGSPRLAERARSKALAEAAEQFSRGQQIEQELGQQLADLVSEKLSRTTAEVSTIARIAEKLRQAKGLESAVRREINLAQDPLLRTQEAMHPVREEITALTRRLKDIQATRPLTTPEKEALIAAQAREGAFKTSLSGAKESLGIADRGLHPVRREIEALRLERARMNNEGLNSVLPELLKKPLELARIPWLAIQGAKKVAGNPAVKGAASKAKKALSRPIVRRLATNAAARSVRSATSD